MAVNDNIRLIWKKIRQIESTICCQAATPPPGDGGTTVPGGSNTQYQYNNSGAFGGSNLTYNNATGANTLTGSSNTPQLTLKAAAGQTVANPILKFTDSVGTELLRITADNQVNTFIGYAAGAVNNFAGGGTDNTAVGYGVLTNNTTGNLNTAMGKRSMVNNVTGSGNSALGAGAVQDTTTGSNNVGIGYHALELNTTGNSNVAVGMQALVNNNGSGNVAVGESALLGNTAAVANTAVGSQAMYNTNASGNSALGSSALYTNSVGLYNSALGANALFSTNGNFNTGVGTFAGQNNAGNGNVYLGFQAGQNATGDNQLYIANTNTTTPLIKGDFSANTVTVNGNITVTGTSGTGTKLATTDASGVIGRSTINPAKVNYTIDTNVTQVNNLISSVTDLHSINIDGSSVFVNAGDGIRFHVGFRFAINGNSKNVTVLLGGQILTGVTTNQTGDFTIYGTVTRVTATTLRVVLDTANSNSSVVNTITVGTLVGNIIFKSQAQGVATSDITQYFTKVIAEPA